MGDNEANVPRETVAGEVAHLMAGWEQRTCGECNELFMARASSGHVLCPTCSRGNEEALRMKAEVESITSRLPGYMPEWLKRAGMSPREMSAKWMRIPDTVRAVFERRPMPGGVVDEMIGGGSPRFGFGLVGGAGQGKTFALSALVKLMVKGRWDRDVPRMGRRAITRSWLGWVSWPEMVNRLRVASTHEDGLAAANSLVEGMAEVEILVLDDIGVERMRGTYEEDWAASQLEVIVDARYNEMRPTFYTMNLTREEFHARYGARMFSRLCGENPAFTIPAGPDLRMVKK